MSALTDKVVIITGASSGIGASTCVHLSQYNPKLVLASRNVTNLTKVSQECQAKGLSSDRILVIQCDVDKENDLENLVDITISKFGQIDVLVNNAGSSVYRSIMETTLDMFDQTVRTNLRAPFYLSQLCIPHLIKTQGNIVNISSISSTKAFPTAVAYCIAKAGLDHLTRTLAVDLAPKKVRVNSVNPGVIITNFQKNAGMADDIYTQYIDRQKSLQPLGGAGDPEEVAKAIRFLASDESSFVTGQLIFVDGGRHVFSPC
ncbi:3-oxoacyl-[acyl-carrier-protein] reductase FabG-like isoform X1 [Ylistrum balloti]|uniref:3-oxoacyl-[acyl-carrier-protein] reductase FabG-like isoform X1 n=1 Tax=Ylistrum balloti TaxID=509963 RepID=UPI0029058F09|nr:3-oxoacyl-[acyl-carrier-protein] reductase FabG-like isoform X1 [Ylistrum balloti]